jgi:hypothetical protein
MTLDEINRRSPAAPQRSPATVAAHKLHGGCRFPVTTHLHGKRSAGRACSRKLNSIPRTGAFAPRLGDIRESEIVRFL